MSDTRLHDFCKGFGALLSRSKVRGNPSRDVCVCVSDIHDRANTVRLDCVCPALDGRVALPTTAVSGLDVLILRFACVPFIHSFIDFIATLLPRRSFPFE